MTNFNTLRRVLYAILLLPSTAWAQEGSVQEAAEGAKESLSLVQKWSDMAMTWLREDGPGFLIKLVVAALILIAFSILAAITRRVLHRSLDKTDLAKNELLEKMVVNVAGKLVLLLGFMVALTTFGFNLGPVIAGMGVAGFVLGFALKDSLGNFAAGVMILIYQPFDIGHFVEVAGVKGTVSGLSIASTTLMTPDNQKLIIPNGSVWGDVIRNVTCEPKRRVDFTFGIGYEDDMDKAEGVLKGIVTAHDAIMDDPAPVIKVHTLNESSVDFVVRAWCKTGDYWNVYWDVTRAAKEQFDASGISIPFPQRDVHLYQTNQQNS